MRLFTSPMLTRAGLVPCLALALASPSFAGDTDSAEPVSFPPLVSPVVEPTAPTAPIAANVEGEEGGFVAAFLAGEFWLNLRYRFEEVDQDTVAKESHASTVRTAIGYKTGTWNGLRMGAELEDVRVVGKQGEYNNSLNGQPRPLVADPEGGELNQAYLDWDYNESGSARIGRQRINLDNQRHVGTVSWRQNEQTYDAASVTHSVDNGSLFVAYVDNVNRVLGDDHAAGDAPMTSILANASYNIEGWGKVTGYWYDLDYVGTNTSATTTVGARLAGKHTMGEDTDVTYAFEYANQSDTGDNTLKVDANYMLAEVGATFGPITAKVGHEVQEGTATGGEWSFTTPLATGHKFNGWADMFLVTPMGGLEDTYVTVGGKVGKVKLGGAYHAFAPETGSGDYGTEIDLVASRPLNDTFAVGVKYAAYDKDKFGLDTNKLWFWLTASI